MRVPVPGTRPRAAYELLRDFSRYPDLTDAVEEVVVHPADTDGSMVSEWLVHFRKGLLKWTERDVFIPDNMMIKFTQIFGDFDFFEGEWRIEEREDGSEVYFDASFDMGIPTLAELLDPVAEASLRDNILRILDGLYGSPEAPADDTAARAGRA